MPVPVFWTAGPVPMGRLADFALPRPQAEAAVLSTLRDGLMARIGGPAAQGRTTLAYQCAAALDRPIIHIEPAPTARMVDVARDLRAALPGNPEPDGVDRALALAGNPVLLLDGGPESLAADLARTARRSVIYISEEGIVPDPIGSEAATSFLQRRSRLVGLTWTTDAMHLAVDWAGRDPGTLQWIGYNATSLVLGRQASRIESEDLIDAATIAAHHPPRSMMKALARLQGVQAELLFAMARRPHGRPAAWGKMAGCPPNAVSVHLSRLVQAGLVRRPARGQYILASQLLPILLQSMRRPAALIVGSTKAP